MGHARTSKGLLDENRKSRCTWNWLVLYGNHVCHSTVHWLSIDSAIITKFYLVFKNTKNCWCHFVTDMIVKTYAEFGRNCLKNEILHNVQSVALGVCFSIETWVSSERWIINISCDTALNSFQLVTARLNTTQL